MTYTRGPAHPPARPLHRVIEGLIAQRRLCGGEKCARRNCHRCGRLDNFRRKERRS